MLDTSNTSARGNQYPAYEKPCIVKTSEVVNVKRLIQVKIGQGEGDTKWNGWYWKLLLIILIIIKNVYAIILIYTYII